MVNRFAALLLLLIIAGGCATDVRTYSIQVRNASKSHVTLNLTKDVPQSEYDWASPEDLDDGRVRLTREPGGANDDLPPGYVASVSLSGHFGEGVHAILRIYRGKHIPIRDQLEMKVGPNRLDVPLKPGINRIIIREKDENLSVETIQ